MLREVVASDLFKAATWNVYQGTRVADLEPTFANLVHVRGVSVLVLQEAGAVGLPALLEAQGLVCHRYRSEVVAWDPTVWVSCAVFGVSLAATTFFSARGTPRRSTSAVAILADHAGRSVTVGSYHLPPHVQVGREPNVGVPRRLKATSESVATMKALGELTLSDAVLFGGDDNVDEWQGKRWAFMLRGATGLRQVQAPDPTLGSRRVDDFRVKGLSPGGGVVVAGASDHKAHVRGFRWRPKASVPVASKRVSVTLHQPAT